MGIATASKFASITCLIFLYCIPFRMAVASEPVSNDQKRPRVALVLSGGGALGMAHIGVLQQLEQMSIPVDCVVGTSMGALIGGAYANGVTPDKMAAALINTDISQLFDDNPPRADITQNLKRDDYRAFFDFALGFKGGKFMLPSGASSGYKFELFLKKLLNLDAARSNLDFNQLPLPYRAVVTDLETGEMKVFNHGRLTRVMRASMSLPAIVAPISIDDRTYIDGGLVRNLPVDIGRELCGDVVIAVNLGSKPKSQAQIQSSVDVALQSLVLLTEQNVAVSLAELGSDDILISPQLADFDLLSFDKQREIIDRGVAAAIKQQPALRKLAVSPQAYQQWRASRFSTTSAPVKIKSIAVRSSGYVTPEAILREIDLQAGDLLDQKQLHNQLEKLYGRGDFSYVDYSIDPEEAGADLIIYTDNKSWGPSYVRFGVGALTDFTSRTQFNLLASYRDTWVNSYGAEWRTDLQFGYDSFLRTEFNQPLQLSDGAFVLPYLEARRYFKPFYIAEVQAGEYTISRRDIGVDVGVTGSLGEFRIGGYFSRVNSKPEFSIATPLFSDKHIDQSGFRANLIIDQLDSVSFPRYGTYLKLFYDDSDVDEGSADYSYRKAQVIFTGAYSMAKHTLNLHYEWGDELSGLNDLPVQETFTLGGPGRLSGLFLDQLNGSRYSLASLTYYYQLNQLPTQLGRGLYAGLSLETGKINDGLMENPDERINAGSLFVAADTILGNLKISYGVTDTEQHTWYLQVGPRLWKQQIEP